MEKIIVIGGMPRSGTNLARRIIGSHSTIAIPPAEFNFLHRIARGIPLGRVLANRRLKTWEIPLADLQQYSPRDAYLEALRRYAHQVGKIHIGEKTPLNELQTHLLDQWFPGEELKFVQMVRNPIDVAASRKQQRVNKGTSEAFALSVRNLAYFWQRSVALGLARQFTHPSRHLVVRYEDLTQAPKDTAKRICQFLGVDFEAERMLSLDDYSSNRDNSSFSADQIERKTAQRVYTPGSRREHLKPSELALVGELCGETAWALGYVDPLFHVRTDGPQEAALGPTMLRRLKSIAQRVGVWSW